jgi:MFS family permease
MNDRQNKILFWGCWIALITTAYAFFSRMYLCDVRFNTDFNLNDVMVGGLKGAGIWPFGVSIIVFSLIIDKIGYKVAMWFSVGCYVAYTLMAFAAYGAVQGVTGEALIAGQKKGYWLLYWGSIILGLGNGTVEAYINPVVATLFNRDKTKWLNMLHAGWPGGLVLGGFCTIFMAERAAHGDWRLVLGLILVPVVIYTIMLAGLRFPKSEREQAGVSYVDMLKELGAFGALVGFGLVFAQIGVVFQLPSVAVWAMTAAVVVLFGVVTKSFGRGILALLIIIMMPLAITELGTDGWITGLMQDPMKAAGYNPGWVLVYTSAIMMALRFVAGPIAHKLSPLGLLAAGATLAILGLTALSKTNGAGMAAIFAAATLYACGKTFFWPTMLGVTAEQCPKGGALTLNTISGIGMLAVGILGFPFIGYLQESTATAKLEKSNPALYQSVTTEQKYWVFNYRALDRAKVQVATAADSTAEKEIHEATAAGQFGALAKMAGFPTFMLAAYICLIVYFRGKGGYKAVHLMPAEQTTSAETKETAAAR